MSYLPLLAGGILQLGTLFHVIRMWRERSARGQSIAGWTSLFIGLSLWLVFYCMETPEQIWAIVTTVVSLWLCLAAMLTVAYFRLEKL